MGNALPQERDGVGEIRNPLCLMVLRGLFSLVTPKKHSWAKFGFLGGIFDCFGLWWGLPEMLDGWCTYPGGWWGKMNQIGWTSESFKGAVYLQKTWVSQIWSSWWYFWLLWGPEKGPWAGGWVMHPLKRVTGKDNTERPNICGFKGGCSYFSKEIGG